MNDQSKDKTQIEATKDEVKMLEGLRKNPIFAARISQLVAQFEEEIANGMDAHEAEEALIDALQDLGATMMSQWAKHSQHQAVNDALKEHPNASKHTKKKSNGIAPSDSSQFNTKY